MSVLNATAISPIRSSTVRAAATDEDLSPSLPTRIILPKKKPQKWSTGVAPGEYGGPPTSSKLRKYWGGRGSEDPVTATDDFIWNKEFLARMQRLLRDGQPNPEPKSLFTLKDESDSGFLSLNRAMSLDSVDIDLSNELKAPPKPLLEEQVEAARRGRSLAESPDGDAAPRWRFVPTRREQDKWDRATKAATGGSDVILRESKKAKGDPKVLAAQSRKQYIELKTRLQILTLGIGGSGVISAYFAYSPEIAASFGAGLLGSFVYIRMLGNTVDSMADGARGFVKGAVGQPRLLVPFVLVMMYSRWNEIVVPKYGLMHLELIPMLVGFFTYKVATFVQAIQDAVFLVDKE